MTFVLLLSDEKTHLPDLYALHDFINTFYLGRHDDELAALQAEQRPGRPKSKQLLELEERIEKEKREYREGMEVPDLCNDINVSILREWQGDPQAMHLFRFVRISSQDRYVLFLTTGICVLCCKKDPTSSCKNRKSNSSNSNHSVCLLYTSDAADE